MRLLLNLCIIPSICPPRSRKDGSRWGQDLHLVKFIESCREVGGVSAYILWNRVILTPCQCTKEHKGSLSMIPTIVIVLLTLKLVLLGDLVTALDGHREILQASFNSDYIPATSAYIMYNASYINELKYPRAPLRPSIKQKKQVGRYKGSRVFALSPSLNSHFPIRHAPIPRQGSPWPLPQHYYPENIVFTLNSKTFRIYATGETCDILQYAFKRSYRNIFGADFDQQYEDSDISSDKKQAKTVQGKGLDIY